MNHPIFIPRSLDLNSTVGITCPSGYLPAEKVAPCVVLLQQWGFNVRVGDTVGKGDQYFSGTDDERRRDLQTMLDSPDLGAIIMGRGGYGLSRILDSLDFAALKRYPKWICGFSDITLLHLHLQNRVGMASFHSPMCAHFKPAAQDDADVLSFRDALWGLPAFFSFKPGERARSGLASGILTGGNLALFAHSIGTATEVDTRNKLLFLEDVGEYRYSLDRMMMQLERAGKLNGLAGIVFGGFTDIKDTERPFGQEVLDILWDKVKHYKYPVAFQFPAGHQTPNYTLRLGVPHLLTVDAELQTATLETAA